MVDKENKALKLTYNKLSNDWNHVYNNKNDQQQTLRADSENKTPLLAKIPTGYPQSRAKPIKNSARR